MYEGWPRVQGLVLKLVDVLVFVVFCALFSDCMIRRPISRKVYGSRVWGLGLRRGFSGVGLWVGAPGSL